MIADYQKEVLREYLSFFAKVKYQIVYAKESGTCSGIAQALERIPENQPFMLVWSDLILLSDFLLPDAYERGGILHFNVISDYIGISKTFPCRWSYRDNQFTEEYSYEYGVVGFFLFHNKLMS